MSRWLYGIALVLLAAQFARSIRHCTTASQRRYEHDKARRAKNRRLVVGRVYVPTAAIIAAMMVMALAYTLTPWAGLLLGSALLTAGELVYWSVVRPACKIFREPKQPQTA